MIIIDGLITDLFIIDNDRFIRERTLDYNFALKPVECRTVDLILLSYYLKRELN